MLNSQLVLVRFEIKSRYDCFDMVIEAVRNQTHFLIGNGTAGIGKSHIICRILAALGRKDVLRGYFTAKASF